jgi:hypothetical protein
VVFPVLAVLIAYGIRLPWRPLPFAVVYGALGALAVFVYAFGRS